tara:strand:+ start:127 stop:495 length:369 start_codon:yes stop_codon:yes gene_type:complete
LKNKNYTEILTCHCKSVQIELQLEKGIEELVRCNCSLCKRRGSIMAKIKLEKLKVIKGENKLSVYKFGKKRHAEHFFCSVCGIYTHHRSYTNPENFEFNVACIDNINSFEYKEIPVFDGEKL